ncbi:hypothetical protein AK812_SmicGene9141 [Symbiodinium microadriaticum]|uniref:Uncharacterized protein n=1 Tax=Symbiodinium microadriaticum TaxID=2951 RepID=A0A1Q9EJ50_SYMMI|nr:hypothetical protein AK812_SmicGene9141 [Symbiodinium microadriaticum]
MKRSERPWRGYHWCWRCHQYGFAPGFGCRNEDCSGNIEQEWAAYGEMHGIPQFKPSPQITELDDGDDNQGLRSGHSIAGHATAELLGLGAVHAETSAAKLWSGKEEVDGSLHEDTRTEISGPLSSVENFAFGNRRLANPSSFLDLEVAPGETLLFSKRDAATYFDTLAVPSELRSWFGQPPVSVKELAAAGLSYKEIHGLCDDVPWML